MSFLNMYRSTYIFCTYGKSIHLPFSSILQPFYSGMVPGNFVYIVNWIYNILHLISYFLWFTSKQGSLRNSRNPPPPFCPSFVLFLSKLLFSHPGKQTGISEGLQTPSPILSQFFSYFCRHTFIFSPWQANWDL